MILYNHSASPLVLRLIHWLMNPVASQHDLVEKRNIANLRLGRECNAALSLLLGCVLLAIGPPARDSINT
eukprot:3618137-Pleurochrysis_carterae.AAC.2